MKNIIVFTKDIFFKKNLIDYVIKKKLPYKLYFFKGIDNNALKIKNLANKNLFVIINLGLSGSIQFNIKNGSKIYENNTKIYFDIITNLKILKLKRIFFVSASCAYPSNKKILNERDYGFPPLEITSYLGAHFVLLSFLDKFNYYYYF